MRIELFLLSAMLLLPLAGGAETVVSPPKTGSVAVISMQEAIVTTREGKKASDELNAKVQPKQKDFEQRQREVAGLQSQLDKGNSVLSEDARNRMLQDIEGRKRKLERDVADAREDLTAEQQRLLQSLGQRMMTLVEKYAKDNGYQIVLDISNPNTPVLYASTAVNITQEMVTEYDRSNPAAGSPTPPSH